MMTELVFWWLVLKWLAGEVVCDVIRDLGVDNLEALSAAHCVSVPPPSTPELLDWVAQNLPLSPADLACALQDAASQSHRHVHFSVPGPDSAI